MITLKHVTTVALCAASCIAITTPAVATITTFASFSPAGQTTNVQWANSNGSIGTGGAIVSTATATTSVSASRRVKFSFLQASLAPKFTGIDAEFLFRATAATGNIASLVSGFLIQNGIVGTYSFRTTKVITFGGKTFAVGANLLSASFGGTSIAGQRNGNTASFSGSTAGGSSLTYTSDFLDFSKVVDNSFSISLDAVTAALQAKPVGSSPSSALRSFRAVASGTFSTDPAPLVAGAPEPAQWFLMVLGFGMVGVSIRRRSTALPN